MRDATISMYVFGVYLGLTGITLLVAPNFLLGLLGISATSQVWIRVVGEFGIFVSFYYIQAARTRLVPFYYWTVYARASVILFSVTFVLLGLVEAVVLLLALIDLLGAIWTGLALRSEGHVEQSR